ASWLPALLDVDFGLVSRDANLDISGPPPRSKTRRFGRARRAGPSGERSVAAGTNRAGRYRTAPVRGAVRRRRDLGDETGQDAATALEALENSLCGIDHVEHSQLQGQARSGPGDLSRNIWIDQVQRAGLRPLTCGDARRQDAKMIDISVEREQRLEDARVLVELGELVQAEAEVAALLEEKTDDLEALRLYSKINQRRRQPSLPMTRDA